MTSRALDCASKAFGVTVTPPGTSIRVTSVGSLCEYPKTFSSYAYEAACKPARTSCKSWHLEDEGIFCALSRNDNVTIAFPKIVRTLDRNCHHPVE